MAISLVQHKSGTSATNTVTITLTSTGSGNALIVVASYAILAGTGPNLSSVTLGGSGAGFSSQVYFSGDSANNGSLAIWANYSIAGSQTSLVVTAPAGNTPIAVDVYEVSGGLNALDKAPTPVAVQATGATWASPTTAVLSKSAEFAVGVVFGWNNAGTALTFTGPASVWTNETQLTPSTFTGQLSGYQITTTTSALTYSGTTNTTGTNLNYVAGIATFVTGSTLGNVSPLTRVVRAKLPRQPLRKGRVTSSPGNPASMRPAVQGGGIKLQPFRLAGWVYTQYGLLDSNQAVFVLNAILNQQPVVSSGGINVRLGSNAPTAFTRMTELPNGGGYVTGGQTCAFNSAASASITNSGTVKWTNTSLQPWLITGVELWDQAIQPVRWMQADWNGNPVSVATGNTFACIPGSLQISMD